MPFPRATTEARSFGKYTLVAKVATGGMAEIFLARLDGAGGFAKLVCIKRILPHLADDPEFLAMFLNEARLAAMISHANVCQVFELGEVDGDYFIAMEYLEGVPLSCFRRKNLYPSAPDPRLIAGIGVQACEGLHHAHQLRGDDGESLEVIHRDVSANNLFVTLEGTVKVLDFGIAKAQTATLKTSTGAVKGTYAYMAPEQMRNERLDRRVDVFAMGIVLWELLAQKHLFQRETDFLTFQAITVDPIPSIATVRPDVPPALEQVIAKALSRNREDRFPTARALGDALAKAVGVLGGPAQPSAIGEELSRAFPDQLAEQRSVVQIARTGGKFDLAADSGPSIGHGRRLTTPIAVPVIQTGEDGMIRRGSQPIAVPSVADLVRSARPGTFSGGRPPTPVPVPAPTPAAATDDVDDATSEADVVATDDSAAIDDGAAASEAASDDVAVGVAVDDESAPSPEPEPTSSPRASAQRFPTAPVAALGSRRTLVIGAVIGLVVVAGGVTWFATRPKDAPDKPAAASVSTPSAPTAVVPANPSAAPAGSTAVAQVPATAPTKPAVVAPADTATDDDAKTKAAPAVTAKPPATTEKDPAHTTPPAHEAADPTGKARKHAGTDTAKTAAPGFFTIDSSPSYAVIYIDGKSYGETPLINIKLPAGKHRVKAVSPSGATRTMKITIEPDKVAVKRLEW